MHKKFIIQWLIKEKEYFQRNNSSKKISKNLIFTKIILDLKID
jgi:hypothetical protein